MKNYNDVEIFISIVRKRIGHKNFRPQTISDDEDPRPPPQQHIGIKSFERVMMWVAYTHLRAGERRKNRGIIKDRMLEAKLFLTAVDFSMATSRTRIRLLFAG